MSAAVKYLHPTAAIATEALVDASPRNNISYFEAAPEQRLRRALDCASDLQAEVKVLREELARAERVASNYERLLQNALIREQELKALLGKQMS